VELNSEEDSVEEAFVPYVPQPPKTSDALEVRLNSSGPNMIVLVLSGVEGQVVFLGESCSGWKVQENDTITRYLESKVVSHKSVIGERQVGGGARVYLSDDLVDVERLLWWTNNDQNGFSKSFGVRMISECCTY
jgi:hypothetical protein